MLLSSHLRLSLLKNLISSILMPSGHDAFPFLVSLIASSISSSVKGCLCPLLDSASCSSVILVRNPGLISLSLRSSVLFCQSCCSRWSAIRFCFASGWTCGWTYPWASLLLSTDISDWDLLCSLWTALYCCVEFAGFLVGATFRFLYPCLGICPRSLSWCSPAYIQGPVHLMCFLLPSSVHLSTLLTWVRCPVTWIPCYHLRVI